MLWPYVQYGQTMATISIAVEEKDWFESDWFCEEAIMDTKHTTAYSFN